MKKIYLHVLLALVFILPTTNIMAQTQIDCTGDNVFAMYFANGDINTTSVPTTPFDITFAVINATESWLGGFEFSLTTPTTNYFLLSTTLPPNSLNVGTLPDYIVGLGTPLPVTGQATVVMTQTVMTLNTDVYDFYMGPSSVPSIPNTMVYAGWDGGNNYPLFPMDPISGDYTLPVARINGTPLDYCDPVAPLEMVVNITFDGDNDNIAGTSLGATDGFDVDYDLVDQNPSLVFPHPEWNQASNNFEHDIKAAYDPTLELKQWTFVATAQAAQSDARNVVLGFQPNFTANPDMVFTLEDRNTGLTYDLFTQNNLTFFVPDGSTFSHTFDLFIGHENQVEPSLWVDVTASANGLSEATNRLATNSLATDGYDAGLDIPEPIPAPARYVNASFRHETWPLGPRFRTDVRAPFDPTTTTKTWGLQVETDQSGAVVLDFGASFTAQDNIGLQLRDMQSGQTFNLFPAMNYMFTADGFSTYDFEIMLGVSAPPVLDPTSRDLDAGWALVGFPLDTTGRTLNQVILDQAPGYAFMFDHQPGQGYNLLDPTALADQNQGYWIATDTGFNWTMTGSPNLNGQTIALTPGWNLIGNPM